MAVKTKVYNQKAEAVGEIELADKVFKVKANPALLHQAVTAQFANARQVLAHTKDRSEVRGGGKKPWRQKGTGRARAGSSRSPIWIGGGVVFGPTKDRNFKKNLNKKMRQAAILIALSDKVGNDSFAVVDKLEAAEFKTKVMNDMVRAFEKNAFPVKALVAKPAAADKKSAKKEKIDYGKRSVLVICDGKDEKVKYSIRNLIGVKMLHMENINIIDLLKYRNLIMTAAAVKNIESIHAKKLKIEK